jgi:hypothetical protein
VIHIGERAERYQMALRHCCVQGIKQAALTDESLWQLYYILNRNLDVLALHIAIDSLRTVEKATNDAASTRYT